MSEQTSRLSIVVDTRNAESALSRFRSLLGGTSSSTQQASSSVQGLSNNVSTMNGQWRDANGRLRDANGRFAALSQSATQASNSIDGLNRNSTTLFGSLRSLHALIAGSFFAGIAISVGKTADEMQNLDSQIKLVTKSNEQFLAVRGRLREMADDNLNDISATISLYTNSARALQNMGKSQEDVLKFTNAISLAMGVGGKSAQEQAAALRQLGQAMQSGVLRGDEFNSIAENAPILLDLVAKSLNKTRGEVRELAQEGKITADVVYNAVGGATEELQKQFNSMPTTMGQALTVAKNQYKNFTDDVMNGTGGVSQTIAGMIQKAAAHFENFAKIAVAGAAIAMLQFANNVLFAGAAFAKLTTIMKANPLFFLASVVIGASLATRGLDATLNDLGDTITVVGSIVSDLAGFFVDVGDVAYQVFTNIGDNANKTADNSTGAFGGFFNDTGTGFQGFLVGTAKVFDAIAALVRATAITSGQYMAKFVNDVGNFFITLSNNVKTAFAGVVNYVVDSINQSIGAINGLIQQANSVSVLGYSPNIGTLGTLGRYAPTLGQTTPSEKVSFAANMEQQSLLQSTSGLQAYTQAKYKATKATTTLTAAQADLNSEMVKGSGAAYKAAQAKRALEEQDKKNTKAAKEHAKAVKDTGNELVSNTTLKGLRIKSSEATAGGLVTRANSEFAKITQSVLGGDLKYFSAFNDRYHLGKASQHNKGKAFDVVLKDASKARQAAAEIQAAAKQYGYSIKILNEYANPSKNATGGHLHVSILGRGKQGENSFDIKQFDQLNKAEQGAADKALKTQENLEQKRLQIREQYALGVQKIEAGLARKIAEIKEAGFSDKEQTRLIALAQNQADIEKKIYLNGLTDKLNGLLEFKQTEINKIRDTAQKERDAITTNTELQLAENADVKQKMLDAIDEREQYELAQYQLTQDSKISELLAFNKTELQLIKEKYDIEAKRIALSNESPEVKAAQKAANDYQKRKDVLGVFNNQPENLDRPMFFGKGAEGQYQEAIYNNAEMLRIYNEGYAALEASGQLHSQTMIDFQRAYDEAVRQSNESILEAERNVMSERLSIWSQGLDMVGGVWGQMTDIITNAYGKQSAAARAFFFVQKTIAAAQAVVNTEEAATKALAQGGALFGIPMATLVRATGYASAGIILGQGIAGAMGKGFSTGGYTGNMGVNDIAGVVHGKEYVLNAAATKRIGVDNLNAMNKGASIGNNNVSVNVVVNADGSSDVQANAQMGKQMGDAIKAAVLQTIVQEKRQGGLLAR